MKRFKADIKVRVNPNTLRELKRLARDRELAVSAVVREAIAVYIKHREAA